MHLEIHFIIAAVALGVYQPTAATQLNAHGETAEPAKKLKPRNYNPHPYARDFSEISDNDLQSAPSGVGGGGGSSPAATDNRGNHVKRRQSPALFNQGPIQFPSNDVGDVAPANNRRISVGVGTRLFQAQRPATAATDYDDYDQQSVGTYNKKHYAFSYVVRDHESGDDFSHSQQQQQDGAVRGSYKVQLPDGRTQVVKYTADEGGYKADVSYIEDNHIAPSHQPHQPPTQSSVSPHLLAAEPIYKYYKTLQDTQQQHQHQHQQQQQQPQPTQYVLHQPQLQRSHLNYASLSGGYTIPAVAATPTAFAPRHHGHLIATPSTAYHHQQQQRHPQPTQSTLQYVQNVQIDTYQTAPHLQQHHQLQQYQQQPPQVQPTRIVFPNAPTPYQDIHVLPSPRPLLYASTAPFVSGDQHRLRLSPKNTNIVSSPATLLARPGLGAAAPVNYNYRDYDYQQQGQHQAQQLVFVATQATPEDQQHQQGIHHQQAVDGGVVLQPNQALYYKHSR